MVLSAEGGGGDQPQRAPVVSAAGCGDACGLCRQGVNLFRLSRSQWSCRRYGPPSAASARRSRMQQTIRPDAEDALCCRRWMDQEAA